MNELDGELARPLGKPRRSWQGRSRVDEAAVGVSVGAWPEPRPAWEDRPLLEKVSAWTKLPARIPARLSPLAQHPRPSGVNISDLHPLSPILNMILAYK